METMVPDHLTLEGSYIQLEDINDHLLVLVGLCMVKDVPDQ